MELDEFVSKTIIQLINGVRLAQKECGVENINPYISGATFKDTAYCTGDTAYPIDFDVAVTVNESNSIEAGSKISVLGVNVGGGASGEASSNIATRIKFRIPVIYPRNG